MKIPNTKAMAAIVMIVVVIVLVVKEDYTNEQSYKKYDSKYKSKNFKDCSARMNEPMKFKKESV